MTSRRRVGLALLGTLLLVRPSTASADVLLTPFAGVSIFDGENKGTFGASIGFGGLIGVDFEAARLQLGTYEGLPIVDLDAHATTFMGNFVVRLPAGPVQPYGAVGIGAMRVTGEIDVPFVGDVVSADAQDVAWNIGGGVHLFPTPSVGIRGDVRHFRTTDVTFDDILDIGGIDELPLPEFDFWRVTAGVTIKF